MSEAYDYIKNYHHKDAEYYIGFAKQVGPDKIWEEKIPVNIKQLTENNPNLYGEDKFFSLNSFYKPKRATSNIRHLRALYVDIDCYTVDMLPIQVLKELEENYFNKIIPEPNAVTFTGQGLNCIWWIYHAPKQAMKSWQRVNTYIYETLKNFGADSKCTTDPARVFRVPGTINTKNGNKVQTITRHENRYYLGHLLEEYTPWPVGKQYKPKVSKNSSSKQKKTILTLYWKRIQDLTTLQNMRNNAGETKGYRELLCFLYRYWACSLLANPQEALESTLKFNSNFAEPLTESEVISATKSADKQAMEWRKAYNSFEVNKNKALENNKGYYFSNKWLIEKLQITAEEQRALTTIISKEEVQARDTVKKRKERRDNGVQTRQEYLHQQENKTATQLKKLRQAIEDNPKIKRKELAEILGVSGPRITQLKKQL